MANTAVSSVDQATIRTYAHSISAVTLDIVAPQTVATLTVSSVPATVPFVNLTVTGSMTDVEIGQLVRVVDGSTHKAWAVVRKTPVGSTLYISPVSLGAPGYPEAIENVIAVGDTVTVYTHRPLFGLYSTIQSATFYKQWDVPYSDQNSQPPPVANAGAWQRASVSVGASATFTLPKAGSNTSFALGAATISSYLWTLPTGVSLAGGYADSDSVIEVEATAGQHLVSLLMEDSLGKQHTAYVWLFVSDGSTYTSFGEQYLWNITGDTQTRQGREITVSLSLRDTDTAPNFDVILPHAGALITITIDFDGHAVADGVLVDTFIGYVVRQEMTHTSDTAAMELTIQAPMLVAKDIPQPPQLITEVAFPLDWTEVTSALSNPRGSLYYAIKWHTPALLDMHDLDAGSLITPRRLSYDYGANNLYDACDVAAQNLLGNVGSASNGTTVLRQNPMYENNTFRNALATVWTWLAQDIRPPLQYTRELTMPTSELRGGGFSYDGTTIGTWMAIKRWYAGVAKQTIRDFSVTAAGGLTRVKEVIGHAMAETNNPTPELSLSVMRYIDIVDPVYMVWHKLAAASAYDPRGIGWTDVRMLPTRVSRRWTNDAYGITCEIEVSMQPETYGMPGEELPIGSAASSLSQGWNIGDEPYEPEVDGLPNLIVPWDMAGLGARTVTFLDSIPHYQNISGLFIGTVNDICWDYGSDFFVNGYKMLDELRVFVVTVDDVSLNVYRVSDIRDASPTVTLLTTYTMNDDSNTTNARVVCSKTVPDNVAVAWHDQTGVLGGRSTDGGAAWGAAEQVGSVITDAANDNCALGFAAIDDDYLVFAPDASSQYGVYWSIAGAAWALATNSETSPTPGAVILPDYDGNYWVAIPETTATNDFTITFDPGGYTDYGTIEYSAYGTGTLGTSGNPDNAPEWTAVGGWPSSGNFNAIEMNAIDLPADFRDVDLTLTADIYRNVAAGPSVRLQTDDGSVEYDYATVDDAWNAMEITGLNYSDAQIGIDIRLAYLTGNAPHAGDYVCIDNIKFTKEAPGTPVDAKLYYVKDYNSTDTWNDVTPGTDHIPRNPYALALDTLNPANVLVTGTDDVADVSLYISDDTGATWTPLVANYPALKQAGDIIIYGGADDLEVTTDIFVSSIDKTGDLPAQWGSGFTVKGLLALL